MWINAYGNRIFWTINKIKYKLNSISTIGEQNVDKKIEN